MGSEWRMQCLGSWCSNETPDVKMGGGTTCWYGTEIPKNHLKIVAYEYGHAVAPGDGKAPWTSCNLTPLWLPLITLPALILQELIKSFLGTLFSFHGFNTRETSSINCSPQEVPYVGFENKLLPTSKSWRPERSVSLHTNHDLLPEWVIPNDQNVPSSCIFIFSIHSP